MVEEQSGGIIERCDFRCGDCCAWESCTEYSYERDDWGTDCTSGEMEERARRERDATNGKGPGV